jgi:hypothetical protein
VYVGEFFKELLVPADGLEIVDDVDDVGDVVFLQKKIKGKETKI